MAFVLVLLVLPFENRGEEKGQGGVCVMRDWFKVAREFGGELIGNEEGCEEGEEGQVLCVQV